MSDQLSLLRPQTEPSLEDLVLGFMRLAQDRGVKSFPLFNTKLWQLFLIGVRDLLSHLIPPSINIEFDDDGPYSKVRGREGVSFALSVVAVMDFKTQRMWLNREDELGREFSEEFTWLAEEMMDIARRIKGFFEY